MLGVLIHRGHQKILDGVVPLEVSLYFHFIAHHLKTSAESLSIGYHSVDVMVVGVAIVIVGYLLNWLKI